MSGEGPPRSVESDPQSSAERQPVDQGVVDSELKSAPTSGVTGGTSSEKETPAHHLSESPAAKQRLGFLTGAWQRLTGSERRKGVQEKERHTMRENAEAAQQRLDETEQRIKEIEAELAEPDADKDRLQNLLQEAERERSNDYRLIADQVLDRLRHGEKVDPEQLTILALDVTHNAERAALAELVVNQLGFATFQAAMSRLRVDSAISADTKAGEALHVTLERDRRYSALKEIFSRRTAVSAGISAATVGVIGVLGGPISLVGLAGGVVGGALGRLGADYFRHRALGHEEIGQKVIEDALYRVLLMQREAKQLLESAGDDQDKRAAAMNKLLMIAVAKEQGLEGESERRVKYQQLERKYQKKKAIYSFLGAVGGASLSTALSSFFSEGIFQGEAVRRAGEDGIRVDHDDAGNLFLQSDPSLGHEVYQTNDGLWRYAIEQKDIIGGGDVKFTESALRLGDNWHEHYHQYLSEQQIDQIKTTVLNQYPELSGLSPADQAAYFASPDFQNYIKEMSGVRLEDVVSGDRPILHVKEIATATDALPTLIQQQLWQNLALTTATMAAATALSEGAATTINSDRRISADQLRADNKPLIDALEAHAVTLRLHKEGDVGSAAKEQQPGDTRADLEKLARELGMVLPSTPGGREPDWWNRDPTTLAQALNRQQLPGYSRRTASGDRLVLADDGSRIYDFVLEADPESDQIVYAYRASGSEKDRPYVVKRDTVTNFLKTHGHLEVGQRSGASDQEERPPTPEPTNKKEKADIQQQIELAVSGQDVDDSILSQRINAASAETLYRYFEQLRQRWAGADGADSLNDLVVIDRDKDPNGRPAEYIDLHFPDGVTTSLKFTESDRGYSVKYKDYDGTIIGTKRNPLTVGQVVAFLREANDRLAAVSPEPPAPPAPEPDPGAKDERRDDDRPLENLINEYGGPDAFDVGRTISFQAADQLSEDQQTLLRGLARDNELSEDALLGHGYEIQNYRREVDGAGQTTDRTLTLKISPQKSIKVSLFQLLSSGLVKQ